MRRGTGQLSKLLLLLLLLMVIIMMIMTAMMAAIIVIITTVSLSVYNALKKEFKYGYNETKDNFVINLVKIF